MILMIESSINLGAKAMRAISERARLKAEWDSCPEGHAIFDFNFEQFAAIKRRSRPLPSCGYFPHENRLH